MANTPSLHVAVSTVGVVMGGAYSAPLNPTGRTSRVFAAPSLLVDGRIRRWPGSPWAGSSRPPHHGSSRPPHHGQLLGLGRWALPDSCGSIRALSSILTRADWSPVTVRRSTSQIA